MSTRPSNAPLPADAVRRRLPREDRYRQLMDEAWRLVHDEGADALTLARLGERCGVTKPVVYDHFGTLAGLLTALYLEFEARQTQAMEEALAAAPATLAGRAAVMAASYVDCFIAQGRELPGVIGALQGTPEMHEVKRRCERDFIARCRAELAPFSADGELAAAGLWAIVGAAESLSAAAVERAIPADQARQELTALLVSLAKRRRVSAPGAAAPRRARVAGRKRVASR